MASTLEELLTPQTAEQVFAKLLALYQAEGFPVQSWQVGGVERTRLMAIATVVTDLSANYIPVITAGGFVDYAELLTSPEWLRLLAKQVYNINYNPATFTLGNIKLTSATKTYTITAGQLIATFGSSGNRYINTGAGTVSPGSPLSVQFKAEFSGAKYNDPSSSGALSLVTALPGVTLTNPPTNYSSVAHSGYGTGTVTPGPGDSPVGSHTVIIRIDSSGAAGVASWSYSIDAGVYVSAGAVALKTNMGGYGISVTLANGASGTSFAEGDTYTFSTPGSWITAQGADDETNASLAKRCRNRWSTLSDIPTRGYYELLATSVPGVGGQVTQVVVLPDATVNNKVNIIIAGPEGALPGATVTAVQSYINLRPAIADRVYVTTPSQNYVTIGAIVTVNPALAVSAQAAIETSLRNYVLETPINGVLRIAEIIDRIMDVAGVIDVSSVTIAELPVNYDLSTIGGYIIAAPDPITPFDIVYVSGS